MQRVGMPLLVHGEIDASRGRRIRSRDAFHRRVAGAAASSVSRGCKVVFEHITTARAVEFVDGARPGVARDHHAAASAAQPQCHFRRRHQAAFLLPAGTEARARPPGALEAATGGNPRFFLGTDSAPHERATKENACGCAGMFTAHAAIELYAEAFEAAGRLDRLEAFAAISAPTSTVCRAMRSASLWSRSPGCPLQRYDFGGGALVPYRGGEPIAWRLADSDPA